jgi:RNA polymerase sigma-70 factor (ECF subfamily)
LNAVPPWSILGAEEDLTLCGQERMSETPVSLLDRLRDRPDDAAWQRLVSLYTPLLRGWLRRYALPPEDADDLVQDVLGVVVRELPQFRHSQQRGAFRHWLRTILVNRLRGFWRSRRQQPAATGDTDFGKMLEQLADPASALSRQWDQEHDQHVCRRLLEMVEPDFEPNTWRAFCRTVLDGVPAADVAAETGLSVNAVLIAKSRVLRRLRRESRGLTD